MVGISVALYAYLQQLPKPATHEIATPHLAADGRADDEERVVDAHMVLIYASHAAYCALLGALLARFESCGSSCPHLEVDESLLLIWFLRVFTAWNVFHLLLCVAAFDLHGIRYTSLSDRMRSFSLTDVLLYALAVVANVTACTAAMCLNRIAFGFPLRCELGLSAAMLLTQNILNLRYNATAFERLEPFFASKRIDLRRHMRWSYALSNVGLSLRLFKRSGGRTDTWPS